MITDAKSRSLNITTSGATAVSAVLYQTEEGSQVTARTLYVVNVGDSRAVLVSSQRPDGSKQEIDTECGCIATRLTYDHRAEDVAEQQRIKEAGGFIARNRVLGILAVSRSFGDHGMKDFVIGKF